MSYVFISYRRADSQTITGRINDRLVAAFGEKKVFKDVNDIQPGTDFRGAIQQAIQACDVVLVIIGPDWLQITDAQGKRRLDDPEDFVRLEVHTALQRPEMRVIPVLVKQAGMPSANALSVDLVDLAYRHAVVVRDDPDFHTDMDRLIDTIKRGTPNLSVTVPFKAADVG